MKTKPALSRSFASLLSLLSLSCIKRIIDSSAARSLAALGSAQLASRTYCFSYLLALPCTPLPCLSPGKPRRSNIYDPPWPPVASRGASKSIDILEVLGFPLHPVELANQLLSSVFLDPWEVPRCTPNVLPLGPRRSK